MWPCKSVVTEHISQAWGKHAKRNLAAIMSGPSRGPALSDRTFPVTPSLSPERGEDQFRQRGWENMCEIQELSDTPGSIHWHIKHMAFL